MSKSYLVKTYDKIGDYLGLLKQYDFNTVREKINGGFGGLDIRVKQNISEFGLTGKIGGLNEVEINYKDNFTDALGDKLYSGRIIKSSPDGDITKIHTSGFVFDFMRRDFRASVNAIQYSIGPTQTSDILKEIITNYRAQFSSVSLSENAPVASADSTLGSTRWLGQLFNTTGLTAEQRIISGVRVRLKYNNGDAGNIGCYLYDSDAGAPALPDAAVTNLAQGPSISNASYDVFDFYFDAPYTAAEDDFFVILKSQSSSGTDTYHWETDSDYYANGYKVYSNDDGGTWTDSDPWDMSIELLYVDESRVRINYTATSIDDSNDSQTLKIQLDNYKDLIDRAVYWGPSNWYWYLDKDHTINYHKIGMQSIEINNCDTTTNMTPTNCTLTAITSNFKEGDGAVQIDLDGTGTNNKVEIVNPGNTWDLSSYANSACQLSIPDLSGISHIDFSFHNWGVAYVTYRIVRSALELGWNFLLAQIALAEKVIDSVGTINWSIIDQVDIVIETTSSGVDTSGFIMDDWRGANLYHHDLFWQRDWNLEPIFDFSELSNDFLFYNNQPGVSEIIKQYKDQDSKDEYEHYHSHKVDERVTTLATANLRGKRELIEKSKPNTIIDGTIVRVPYNIPSIHSGHTVSIVSVPANLSNVLDKRMTVIEKITDIKNDACELILAREVPMLSRKLQNLEKKDQDIITENLPPNFS